MNYYCVSFWVCDLVLLESGPSDFMPPSVKLTYLNFQKKIVLKLIQTWTRTTVYFFLFSQNGASLVTQWFFCPAYHNKVSDLTQNTNKCLKNGKNTHTRWSITSYLHKIWTWNFVYTYLYSSILHVFFFILLYF